MNMRWMTVILEIFLEKILKEMRISLNTSQKKHKILLKRNLNQVNRKKNMMNMRIYQDQFPSCLKNRCQSMDMPQQRQVVFTICQKKWDWQSKKLQICWTNIWKQRRCPLLVNDFIVKVVIMEGFCFRNTIQYLKKKLSQRINFDYFWSFTFFISLRRKSTLFHHLHLRSGGKLYFCSIKIHKIWF